MPLHTDIEYSWVNTSKEYGQAVDQINQQDIKNLINRMIVNVIQDRKIPMYHKSYHDWTDRTYVFPKGYKFIEFAKISRKDKQSTAEHIGKLNC